MPTISDVARRTGLSRATVSRVINGYPHVSREKKKLVEQAMKELGYVPNATARRLRRQKTETIAVLVPRIANPFFSELVASMELVAVEYDFQLVVCQTNQSKQRESKYLQLLKTKQVDGLILTSLENNWETIEPYTKWGPIILCNEYEEEADVPMVRLDQFTGSYEATRHLIERGYRKIARCTGLHETGLSRDRRRGFMSALQEAGLPFSRDWLFANAFSIADGKRILREIIALKERPDAVFTGSDEVAAGLLKAAKEYGMRVPGDLAVLGFDDQPIAELVEPPLSTVRQPVAEMGIAAMKLILAQLSDNVTDDYGTLEKLRLQLIVRKST